jgi:hypothetical protein
MNNPTRQILFDHFRKAGPIDRDNPELARLHDLTGLSKEHILRGCLYNRKVSLACAKTLAEKLKIKGISANSFRLTD